MCASALHIYAKASRQFHLRYDISDATKNKSTWSQWKTGSPGQIFTGYDIGHMNFNVRRHHIYDV